MSVKEKLTLLEQTAWDIGGACMNINVGPMISVQLYSPHIFQRGYHSCLHHELRAKMRRWSGAR